MLILLTPARGHYDEDYQKANKRAVIALEEEIKRENQENNDNMKHEIKAQEKSLGRKLTNEEKEKINNKYPKIPSLRSMNPDQIDMYMYAKIEEYNNQSDNTVEGIIRKRELEPLILLDKEHKKAQSKIVDTAVDMLSTNKRFYELREKVEKHTATQKELKEYWQINNDSMGIASGLIKSQVVSNKKDNRPTSVKTEFEDMVSKTIVVQHDSSDNTIYVNNSRPALEKGEASLITEVSAHEIVGHYRDNTSISNKPVAKAIKKSFVETGVPYYRQLRERSALHAQELMKAAESTINNSPCANGGWKTNAICK